MTAPWTGVVVADRIVTPEGWRPAAAVEVQAGRIVRILPAAELQSRPDVVRLPAGVVLAPGFIDTQVNGGGGVMLNAAPTLDSIRTIVAAHRRGGTTGLLPTLITDTRHKLDELFAIATAAIAIPGVLGFHLEGPFINPIRKGVHREDYIRTMTDDDVDSLTRFAGLGRTVVTLAPERVAPHHLRRLVDSGLIIAAGHTAATYDQMRAAANAGLRGCTHLFNAMSQIMPRDGGVVGACFDDRRLFAGIIADGHHVSASNLRLAAAAVGDGRLLLVTDAMATTNAALVSFDLQGRKISLRDDRLTDEAGTLGGAHLTMIGAVQRFADATTDHSLLAALAAAATTPAAYLGLSATHGTLAEGYRADMIAFDPVTFAIDATWIDGHICRHAQQPPPAKAMT